MVSEVATIAEGVNLVWVLICAALVFFMHAGFGMLEAGQVRSKNVSNQLTKNLLTWGVGIVGYFVVGGAIATIAAAITTGAPIGEPFSYLGAGPPDASSLPWAYWLFSGTFAMATATIVSGAVGGRASLSGYMVYSIFVGSIIYPVAVGLTWGGGILAEIGYADFAGSGVVHMVGGVAALTAAYLIGPRRDKFNDDGSSNAIPGHSVALTVLGALILAFGWFGFNLGTAITVFTADAGAIQLADFEYIGRVAVNTALTMGAGAIGAVVYSLARGKKSDPLLIANGLLAGLVSVCAIAAVSSPWGTLVVGFIAGAQVSPMYSFLERFKIDDVVAAFPVHGSAGFIGVMAYPFVDVTAPFSITQVGIQFAGAVTLAAWAAGATFVIYGVLRLLGEARVSEKHEAEGLDMAEHNIESYPEFGGGVTTKPEQGQSIPDGGRESVPDGGSESVPDEGGER
jgi:Amt family ammonium transporter